MANTEEGVPEPPDNFILTSEPGTYPPAFEMNLGITLITGDTLIFEASPNEDFSPPVVATPIVLTDTERQLRHGFQGRLSSGRWYFRLRIESERGNSVPSEVLSDIMPPQASFEAKLVGELEDLKAIVEALPTTPDNMGHNQPPESIGLPPYHDEDRAVLLRTVSVVR